MSMPAPGAARAVHDSTKERVMKSISDSGKVKIGGGIITLIKPPKEAAKAVADSGKVKIGGGNITLMKPAKAVADSGKVKVGGGAITLVKPAKKTDTPI